MHVTPLRPATQTPMRVVVLDDDPVFRTFMGRMLTRIGLNVVGQCSTIASVQKRLEGGDVDAVTVDVVLKGESGLDFIKWANVHARQVLTVLVTARSDPSARSNTDALMRGAAALLPKPTATDVPNFEVELRRVFADGRRGPAETAPSTKVDSGKIKLRPALRDELVAIGVSTGGPPVLASLLAALPRNFDVPIVITQHIPAAHVHSLAQLLGQQAQRTVCVAEDLQPIERGVAYLAGNDKHLLVERNVVAGGLMCRWSSAAPEHFCRPAVDPMFRSVAKHCRGTALGVVLTGMGSDGAQGAHALRERLNPVLAQDEATSVVWGMPGSVINAGQADAVVAAKGMANAIVEWTGFASNAGGTRRS